MSDIADRLRETGILECIEYAACRDLAAIETPADACVVALLEELETARHLNGKWMDERSAALMRAEKAEAEVERLKGELADAAKTIGGLEYRLERVRQLERDIQRVTRYSICISDGHALRPLAHCQSAEDARMLIENIADTEVVGSD